MTDQDRDRFEEMLTILAEIHDKELSEYKLEVYFDTLSDIPIDDLINAGSILARTTKFFPKPSEFRDNIVANTDDMAAIAYAKFFKACAYTPDRTLIFEDPIIHAVIDSLGGWNDELYDKWANIKDEVWLQKRFEGLYQTFAKCGVPENTSGKLIGKLERYNEGRWDINNRPVLIGSKESPVLQEALAEYKQNALESGEDDE